MIAELSRWVLAKCPNARDLTQGELSRYEAKDPIHGWVVPFEHQADRFDLQVVLSQDFPWTKPHVYCTEKFQFLQYPHIEKDGAFCLYPPGTEHNPLNPKGLIWDAIKEATRLIVASYDDDFINDFTDEFDSYWSKTDGGKNIISLLSPGGPSRRVSLWCSTGDYFLADDHTALESWLRSRFPGNKKDYNFNTATHIALNRPILPSEYPRSGSAILRFLRELAPESVELLKDAAATADDKFTVSFEGRTDDGPVFFGVEVTPPVKQGMEAGRRPDMVQKGFRAGKVPPHIRMQRLFGGNKVERHKTMRADASWIHGRDTPTVAPLFDKRVLMIGVGSLGSEVALLLAKTGVGSITLVDPELLDYPNVGRHMLGVRQVWTSKAKSLAEKLAGDFPHMRSIKPFAEDWQSVYGKRSDVFQNTDLIVSTVGSWVAEGRLNQVARNKGGLPPVLYGWAEPFSVAGHAVLIGSNGPCFACGMDHFGKALQPVCEWDTETTRKQPHCGASFQPYGPVSLSGVAALVAKAAMKALLGEVPPGTEAVYWASKEEIAEQGGRFSPDFLNYFTDVPEFGGTRKFEWRQKDDCAFCGGS
ncbi:ThiF family adenylyltransferase [Phaeovulum sp. W22_SRMD_FR3]|uniref:ThiF family adenylyltransferase n=1 Tax=Phaeovulum sp. W22_SRMD_FR3 TaxID=3240274 RepID=UPI003F982CB1